MELICVNDKYTEDYLKIFAKYSIKFPQENEIVELLRVVKYPKLGKTGLIVSGYDGQFIPGETMGIKGKVEVSFDKSRFRTLLNLELTEEEIREFKAEQKGLLERIEIKPKENLN